MALPVTQTAQAVSKASRAKWVAVAFLSGGLALNYVARLAIFSIVPLLRKDLLLSDVVLGLLASSFLWTYGGLSPVAGFLGDRFSRRFVVIASLGTWSVVTVLCGLATAAWQIVLLRVALAVAQVCFMPTANALIADFHGPDTRAKASGLYQAGSYVGIFLAGLPVAYVSTHWGWPTMFFLVGGLGLLGTFLMSSLLPKPEERHGNSPAASTEPISAREALSLLRIPSLVAIVSCFSLVAITYWVLFTYLPLFIYERYHLSVENAAFQATFYMQAAALVANPVVGAVSDWWSKEQARNRFLFCGLISLLGLPALLAIGIGNHATTLAAGLILSGVAMAGADVSWLPMLCAVARRHQRATGYGIMNAMSCLTGGLGAVVTALIMRTIGLGAIIASLGALFVLISLLFVFAAYVLLPRDLLPEAGEKQ